MLEYLNYPLQRGPNVRQRNEFTGLCVEMDLPYGSDRRDVRIAFIREMGLGGPPRKELYNSGSGPRPNTEDVESLLLQLPTDDVLVVLGGDEDSPVFQLSAFVLLEPGGYKYLLGCGIRPKFIKQVPWWVAEKLVKKS